MKQLASSDEDVILAIRQRLTHSAAVAPPAALPESVCTSDGPTSDNSLGSSRPGRERIAELKGHFVVDHPQIAPSSTVHTAGVHP